MYSCLALGCDNVSASSLHGTAQRPHAARSYSYTPSRPTPNRPGHQRSPTGGPDGGVMGCATVITGYLERRREDSIERPRTALGTNATVNVADAQHARGTRLNRQRIKAALRAVRRRRSADDVTALPAAAVVAVHHAPKPVSPRPTPRTLSVPGRSRLELMLPELFEYLADWLMADPATLVRLSHQSRRLHALFAERIWKRACHYWDAKQRPPGWFASWRDFFVLYVCPTRLPKLEVLQDKRCFRCRTPCPLVGRFTNNDRGLVPVGWWKRDFLKFHLSESGQQGFNYRRNGNLLYCPSCTVKAALVSELPEPRCGLCHAHTACAYVRMRVQMPGESAVWQEAERARGRALASLGSAAAAAAWAITSPMRSRSNIIAGGSSSSDSQSGGSSEASLATTIATTISSSDRTSDPAPAETFADDATLDVGRPTFWGQVWNDTVPCAQGIRFPCGRPDFLDAQSVLCGDCVRSLARLGHGRLEVVLRQQGAWSLSS